MNPTNIVALAREADSSASKSRSLYVRVPHLFEKGFDGGAFAQIRATEYPFDSSFLYALTIPSFVH